jgi:putative acetyltransferase
MGIKYPAVQNPDLVGTYDARAKAGGGYVWDAVLEALVLQEEFIDEPETGHYLHVRERRITEWPVEFLSRPKRTAKTIPNFLSPNAPANRLDILRDLAKR